MIPTKHCPCTKFSYTRSLKLNTKMNLEKKNNNEQQIFLIRYDFLIGHFRIDFFFFSSMRPFLLLQSLRLLLIRRVGNNLNAIKFVFELMFWLDSSYMRLILTRRSLSLTLFRYISIQQYISQRAINFN